MKYIYLTFLFIFIGCDSKLENSTYGVYNDRNPNERLVHFENFFENNKHCDEYVIFLNKLYSNSENFYRCQKE